MTSAVNPEIEAVQKEDNLVLDQKQKQERNLGILIAIVSCFFPVAGFVVFINCRENSPKIAKIGGISAIVGVVVNIIIMLLVNSL